MIRASHARVCLRTASSSIAAPRCNPGLRAPGPGARLHGLAHRKGLARDHTLVALALDEEREEWESVGLALGEE